MRYKLLLALILMSACGCKKSEPIKAAALKSEPCNPFKRVSRIYVSLDYEDGSNVHFAKYFDHLRDYSDPISFSTSGVIQLPMEFKRKISVEKEISCDN